MLQDKLHLFEGFIFNPSISKQVIYSVEELKINFPHDYVDFMLKGNGGEGNIGTSYLRLWKMEDLAESNEDYGVNDFAPGLLIIGSDGAGTAYGFDLRSEISKLVEVDFIGLDINNPRYSWNSFFEFIEYLYNS